MEKCNGYAGSILMIDLTHQCVSGIPLPLHYRTRLLSGKALAAQILLDHMTGKESALSEENILVITSSLLTGTGAPGSARFDVASLSPKDDLPAFSNCGGNWGLYLKQSGYDAVILKGKCAQPFWLEISGSDVIFHDAADLWGLGTGACRDRLREELGKTSFSSVCIGPAGEHLIPFASISADGHSTGRAGFGAVLGWKQLKAITVTGTKPLPLPNVSAVTEVNRRWYAHLRKVASENTEEGFCAACPLHCVRHNRRENPILEELGMDAIAAEAAAEGIRDPDIYLAIAMGEWHPKDVPQQKGKGGKRRKICYERISDAFVPDKDADTFCKNFAEVVCLLGQCMFTVNGLVPEMEEVHLLSMINCITGKQLLLEDLLIIGQYSCELERTLRNKFKNKTTSV